MDQFKKAFLNVRESVVRLRRAQTITRSLAWGAYNHMGHDIGSMASGIDSNRASATGRSCRFLLSKVTDAAGLVSPGIGVAVVTGSCRRHASSMPSTSNQKEC